MLVDYSRYHVLSRIAEVFSLQRTTFLLASCLTKYLLYNRTVSLSTSFANIFVVFLQRGAQAKNRTLIAVVPRQCTTIVLQEPMVPLVGFEPTRFSF
jgi:hypothetical protein